MCRSVRTAWIAVLLLAGTSSHAQRTDSLLAEARTPLTVETPAQALDRVRRGLDANPDDAALLALKLRLELDGVGLVGVPGPARRQQHVATARRLVAVDPANALGNEVLGRAALRDFLFRQRFVDVSGTNWTVAGVFADEATSLRITGMTLAELRGRFSGGRMDAEALQSLFPVARSEAPADAARRDAERFLTTAVANAPGCGGATEPLAALRAATEAWADALAEARRAQAVCPDSTGPHLWAALAQYRLGDAHTAEAAFERALERLAPARRARYELVEALLAPDEAAAYHADPAASAQVFWATRDVRLLTPTNERRTEHYARVAEADLLFGWNGRGGADSDRGRIWVRYGAPRSRALLSSNVYVGDAAGAVSDLYETWDYDGFRMVFEDPNRLGEFRTYTPSASAYSDTGALGQIEDDDYVAVDAQLRREAPQQTSYAPERRERVPFLATPFRGASGQTDLVVAFGVPLAARPTADAALALRTGVFVLQDGAAAPVSERRRRRASLPAEETVSLGDVAVWVGAEALRLAPGAYTVAAEFDASDGAAVGYERAPVVVPGFAASGLQVSGLLLAERAVEGAAGPVERGGYGIVPLPLAAVQAGQPLTVYAEAYGLGLRDGRTDYEVELVLVPADERGTLGRLFGRDRRRGVSTRAEASGSRTDEPVVVAIDTSGQPAGTYRLALRIVDRTSGASVEAEREVTLER